MATASRGTLLARRLRRDETSVERKVWRALRDRQLLGEKFRRQHPAAGFILDFYCEDLKLAVEIDGGQHELHAERDAQRTAVLEREGIQVVRFWNNEVTENPEGVLQRLTEVIETRRKALKKPSPEGEGGRAKRGG